MKISLKGKIENSIIFYVLIALACMNFKVLGSTLCLVCALFAILKIGINIKIDRNLIFTFLLTASIAIASFNYYDFNEVVKAFNYFLMYFVGYNGFYVAENKTKFIKRTVFAIFVGYLTYIVLTYVYNIGVEVDYGRVIYNYWTGELIAVTLVGLLSSVVIGYSFYAIVCHKKAYMKIIGIVSIVIMLLVNMETATRTPVLLLAIVYIVMIMIYMVSQKGAKSINVIVLVAIALGAAIAVYATNTFGLRDFINESPIFKRFVEVGMETSRTERFQVHAQYMLDYLSGGENIRKITGERAHNFFQEGHDKYGLFASVSLLLITITVISNIYKLIRLKDKVNVDYLLISMYIAIFVQVCLEPVFDGYPMVMWNLLLIHGMATAYISNRQTALESELK